jgi:succinate dehydrogenase / fumarate reductase cytochrome b subunit
MERETGAREGLKGWLNPGKIGKFGIERLAWLLMRLTGLGLLAYFIGHIYEKSHILDGKAVWDKSLEMTQTTEGHLFLALVIGMCVFHTGNGIRLMIAQMGYGIGKTERPDYPYKPQSINMKGKACIYATLGMAALAMWYGMAVMFA